jgi:hypothetical protein
MHTRTAEVRRSDGLMFHRYMRSLRAFPMRQTQPPGVDIRTCAHCGSRTQFHVDPEGNWATCTSCGQLA